MHLWTGVGGMQTPPEVMANVLSLDKGLAFTVPRICQDSLKSIIKICVFYYLQFWKVN